MDNGYEAGDIIYRILHSVPGWWFADYDSHLHGPFISLSKAEKAYDAFYKILNSTTSVGTQEALQKYNDSLEEQEAPPSNPPNSSKGNCGEK